MKFIFVAVALTFFVSATGNSQNLFSEIFQRKEAKNVVVGSAGTLIVASEFNIAYERKLVGFTKRTVNSIWLKGRYTRFSGWLEPSEASFFDVSAMALLGSRFSYTEIGAGIGVFPVQSSVYPTGNIGYRFQRGRGGIMFRTGVGFPEIFYVGVGYGF